VARFLYILIGPTEEIQVVLILLLLLAVEAVVLIILLGLVAAPALAAGR
jgi:hypothetical protein